MLLKFKNSLLLFIVTPRSLHDVDMSIVLSLNKTIGLLFYIAVVTKYNKLTFITIKI